MASLDCGNGRMFLPVVHVPGGGEANTGGSLMDFTDYSVILSALIVIALWWPE